MFHMHGPAFGSTNSWLRTPGIFLQALGFGMLFCALFSHNVGAFMLTLLNKDLLKIRLHNLAQNCHTHDNTSRLFARYTQETRDLSCLAHMCQNLQQSVGFDWAVITTIM